MSKRLIAGVVVAVVASAVTAGVVVVMGQGSSGPSEMKIAPSEALKPSEITKIPAGTPVADLALPLEYDRFRILPPGSVPVPIQGPSAPPGVSKVRVDVRQSDTLDEFRDHDLFFDPPYIPEGWELTKAHAETVIWDDGSETDSIFALSYERPRHFYIRIIRSRIAPDAKAHLIADEPESEFAHALTLGEIRGVPAVFQHQPPGEAIQATLQVNFVMDDVATGIESVAIDFDELIKIADAMIAQSQEVAS